MPLYIVQFTMSGQTSAWAVSDPEKAIDICANEYEALNDCTDLTEAIHYDQRAAYATDDLMDLYAWVVTHEACLPCKGLTAFFRAFKYEIEDLASAQVADDDTLHYVAFDGDFIWREEDGEWTLGNNEAVEAGDLAQALCAASFQRQSEKMEQVDV